jgi:WD40 repeat protein
MVKRYVGILSLILIVSVLGCISQDEPMLSGTVLKFSGNALIATDDYLYVVAGTTRCVDWDGNLIWETDVQEGLKMVLTKDALFLTTYEYKKSSGVAVVDLDGRILWQKDLGTTPIKDIDASDTLLAASETERLWAFSPNGDTIWEYAHSSPINEIAVAPDSSCVVFIDCSGFINCVENGALVWSQSAGKSSKSLCTIPDYLALAFAPDSSYIVYSSEADAAVVVINPNGEQKWSHPVNEYPLSVAITSDSQHIFVGSSERLYTFTYDGTLLWTAELPGDVNRIAVTPGGEYIAVGCDTNVDLPGLFVVFDSDGTVFWKTKTINIFRGVALSPNGRCAAFAIFKGNVQIFDNTSQAG